MKSLSDKKLNALMGIVKKINSSQDLDETLSLIMDEAKKIIPSESSSMMLIDEETKELYFCLVTGEKSDEVKQIRIPPGRGIAGMVVSTGKAIIISDAENDNRI
ncbi:MAG: GAF domain-containing protein, partial [Syntrophus sp. (in: bacteria)]